MEHRLEGLKKKYIVECLYPFGIKKRERENPHYESPNGIKKREDDTNPTLVFTSLLVLG
jgi:hypothetical protein